jgi:hypothetical protein
MNFKEVKQNILTASTWGRGLVMVLYAILFSITKLVLAAVVLFQFGSMLLTGRLNEALLGLGHSLSLYTYQIFLYLTYNSDTKPFPLSPWPKSSDRPDPLTLPNQTRQDDEDTLP